MLSTPKTVSGKTSYTYRQGTANSEVSFLITTEQISSRNIMTVPVRFLLCFRIPKVFIKATQRKEPFY